MVVLAAWCLVLGSLASGVFYCGNCELCGCCGPGLGSLASVVFIVGVCLSVNCGCSGPGLASLPGNMFSVAWKHVFGSLVRCSRVFGNMFSDVCKMVSGVVTFFLCLVTYFRLLGNMFSGA